PLLTAAEREQILGVWAGTGTLRPGLRPVHELFEAWVERTPDATALVCEEERLTFRELDELANGLARRLRRLGVGPEVPVGLCLERSLGMGVAILGVLKAGGGYVPLDPDLPEERLAHMLDDSGARLLVTQPEFAPLGAGRTVLFLDDATAPKPPERLAGPGHLAYVIYTSGSTGRPKGVMIEHRQLSSYVDGVAERMGLPEGSSYATVSTIAADLGNTVVFSSFATGGTLHVVARERLTDPERMAEYLARHPVDALKIVPSHLAALLAGDRPERVLPRRLAVVGGEASQWSFVDRLRELAADLRVLNHYGPTETTVGVLAFPTWDPAGERRSSIVPLGRPLGGTRILVVDSRLQPVPAGVPGELLAGGPQVTRGYLGRPDLTAERFVPDPQGDGSRVYRTGDLVRFLPDGAVEFLGRIDHQVKIRGFRVELGEVEAALLAHPEVREALVIARVTSGGEPRLVAYVVPRGEAPSDLRAWLGARLSEAMIPSAFVAIPALPLTPNGKVDRRALPDPEPERGSEAASSAPRTPTEEVLAGIFAEVLGVDAVGTGGDFFELGGHSLLATRVIARIRSAFRVDLELRAVFEGRTVSALALRVDEAVRGEAGVAAPPLVRRPRPAEGAPLSFAQERLWFLDRLQPGSTAYNVPRGMELRGPLDVPALSAALSEIVRRHEILRTVYAFAGPEPVQIVLPWEPRALPVVDLSGLPELGAEAARIFVEEAARPFDLERGPIVRTTLLRGTESEHTLLFLTHHIASDGWSLGVLLRELTALYGASPLPELPVQSADFAMWQREYLSGSVLEAQLAYWREKLAGIPAVQDLPADRPRPAVSSGRGAVEPVAFPAPVVLALERIGRQKNATLFMTLLAAFEAFVHRITGLSDLT
ncbi:MAG TPA: amino acid adenylation domain-containing protein, partial [Thermoanaerobaculia bacterium]|nr:amino acid adenylation domain-containing protein [Thermoanaerobaculia bacterium]